MQTAKLFQNGQSQAVRLPKRFRFQGKEVYIKQEGNVVFLIPKDNDRPWEALYSALQEFSPDLQLKREQPKLPKREFNFG